MRVRSRVSPQAPGLFGNYCQIFNWHPIGTGFQFVSLVVTGSPLSQAFLRKRLAKAIVNACIRGCMERSGMQSLECGCSAYCRFISSKYISFFKIVFSNRLLFLKNRSASPKTIYRQWNMPSANSHWIIEPTFLAHRFISSF